MTATCCRKPTMAMFTRFIFSLILIHHHQVKSEPDHDEKLLMSFISKVKYDPAKVNWDKSPSFCDRTGVTCDPGTHTVHYLQLPGKSLIGKIPENTIGMLSHLLVLSLPNNGLTGSIPSDFSNLIYLQQFVLHNNAFTGQLPNINSKLTLDMFDVSNNHLDGSIPRSLSMFDKSNFSGNTNLCGIPFPICNEPVHPRPIDQAVVKKKPKNKLSTGAIVGIAVGGSIAVGSPLVILIPYSYSRKKRNNNQTKIIPPVVSSRKDELTTSAFE